MRLRVLLHVQLSQLVDTWSFLNSENATYCGGAMDVFVKMPQLDTVAWTALISGYAYRESNIGTSLIAMHEL